MRNILLILSTAKTSDKAVEYAIRKTRDIAGELTVLYLLDSTTAENIFDRFTDIGFIGDKPSTEITEAIMKEYRQRGYEALGKIQILSMEANVPFNASTLQGDFLKNSMKMIEEISPEIVVAVKKKRSGIARYFSVSFVDELKTTSPCEVVVFEED